VLNKELLPQHKISFSFLYHLFPGFSVFLSFLLINNSIIQLGFNSNISLAISFLFVGIPIQLFIIFKKGYNINGKLSLDKVIFYRTKIPAFQLFLYVLLFIPYAFMVVLYIEPINNFILQNYFYWIPESFNIENSQINNNLTITIVGFTLLIFIDGVLNPIVEELYFRGFLMPRLSRYLYFSAFISAFLFSISHFWFPWNILQTFLIVLPIYIIVYRTKSIYISIVTHCTGNLIGIAISLFNFFN